MAHPGGRPTKYHEGMPKLLFEAMSSGKSVTRFCSDQDISTPTFYKWVAEHKEFSSAFDISSNKCEAFWEEWLIQNLGNKEVNSALIKMFFTNRFGWSDKKEVDQKTTVSISEDTNRKVREVLDGK